MTSADWPGRWVRERLGYEPRDLSLFQAALTHRSAAGPNNERLEFLGDAVLNLLIAHRLYEAFPQAAEGDLSRLRARVVSREPLAQVALSLGLGEMLQLGSGELSSGGFRRQSILADALEALCGAVFLDGGLAAAEQVIERLFAEPIAAVPQAGALKDPKTRLQEYLQSRSLTLPRYAILTIEGEQHAQTFEVSCEVPELGRVVQGGGLSRARAGAGRAGTRLEPPPRGTGGRRAHAQRDRVQLAAGGAHLTAAAAGTEVPFRSGFAALVGRPNVGKSTLLNALIGEKLSIVTPRPQTTRHRILGVCTLPQAQVAFLDTPGLHVKASRALNRAMNRTATSALAEADLAVLVLEALKWTAEDELTLTRIARAARPAIAAVNKIDRVRPRARLLPYLAALGARHPFLAIVPVSALKADNIADLRDTIAAHLPASPALFPNNELTDRGLPFRIAETIREKLTLELNQEVPYGIAVEVERLAEEDGQLSVDAAIWVDRPGQKPIVIGARGERLKRVGRSARLALNGLLGRRLHLTLWVKVRQNWADNARALRELGVE